MSHFEDAIFEHNCVKYLVDLDDNERLTEWNWSVLLRIALPTPHIFSILSTKFETKLMQLTIKPLQMKYWKVINHHCSISMKKCVPAMINLLKNTLLFCSVNHLLSTEPTRYFVKLCLNNVSSVSLKKFGCCLGIFDEKYEKMSVATSF